MYKIDGWNNFCRVFALPETFSSEFCPGGGIPINFQMVDWFCPISKLPQPTCSKEVWLEKVGKIKVIEKSEEELKDLMKWIKSKNYYNPDVSYLVIFDFGASVIITG